MSREFSFVLNTAEILWKISATDGLLQTGVRKGAHDVLNLWQAEARHDAPHDTGTLRKNIEQKLEVSKGLNADLTLTSNAYRDKFNYAYYQHEVRGNKYLDRSAKRVDPRVRITLENEIRKSIRKAGW